MRVERVERDSSGVAVAAADGSVCRFDQLVFACGAEEARRMLGADASRSVAPTCGACKGRCGAAPSRHHGLAGVGGRGSCCCCQNVPSAPLPPRRLESRLLGNVRYFNDLIVTHEDEGYMRRWEGWMGEGGDEGGWSVVDVVMGRGCRWGGAGKGWSAHV